MFSSEEQPFRNKQQISRENNFILFNILGDLQTKIRIIFDLFHPGIIFDKHLANKTAYRLKNLLNGVLIFVAFTILLIFDATAQQIGTEISANKEKIVGGEVARLRELLEPTTGDLEDLTTAAGQIGDAESLSSNSAENFSGESDLNDGEPPSLSAGVAAWAVGSEGEFSQSLSPVEEPREKVSPSPQTVPRHGQ